MPVHENEHAGKSAPCTVEYGTGDHVAGISAQTRGNPNFAHARAEQVGSPRITRISANH